LENTGHITFGGECAHTGKENEMWEGKRRKSLVIIATLTTSRTLNEPSNEQAFQLTVLTGCYYIQTCIYSANTTSKCASKLYLPSSM